jgi:hypothetical protein
MVSPPVFLKHEMIRPRSNLILGGKQPLPLARIVNTLRSKPAHYWAQAVVLIVLGVCAGEYVSSHDMWLDSGI